MENKPIPAPENPSAAELEELKKTTHISLEEAMSVKAPPKKTTSAIIGQVDEKQITAPITGIPTHTAPIPQTIRLKRPATSPIAITPPDISAAPTVVKAMRPKAPGMYTPAVPAPIAGEAPTVVKKLTTPRPQSETSRIILDADLPPPQARPKTGPMPLISQTEPTPGPKTIRLKRPSTIVPVSQPVEADAVSEDIQTAKKSETAKIELPKEPEQLVPATQRKTIKIKRTDRNAMPRTVVLSRPSATKPAAAVTAPKAAPVPQAPLPRAPAEEDDSSPVFSVLAAAAVVCLFMLVYLLTSQAFGPKLLLPVPSGLF